MAFTSAVTFYSMDREKGRRIGVNQLEYHRASHTIWMQIQGRVRKSTTQACGRLFSLRAGANSKHGEQNDAMCIA